MNVVRQKTKKPTCVGFFVGQNLLTSLRVRRVLLQQQVLERQPGQVQEQLQQLVQVPKRVQLQQPGQVQQPEQAWQPVQPELRFCHRRLRTGPTMQQPEQNISFIFPSLFKDHTKNQGIQSAAADATAKARHFINSLEKCQSFFQIPQLWLQHGAIAQGWSQKAPDERMPTFP